MFKAKKVILLNAGHWRDDPGAISDKSIEAKEAIKIRDLLIPLLESEFIVRSVPDNLNLTDSIKWVNKRVKSAGDGLALSIHLNYGNTAAARSKNLTEATGAETLYYGWLNSSKIIARKLLDKYCDVTGFHNRGPISEKQTRYGINGWVHNTNCWATLIECCFIDNKTDMVFFRGNRDLVADGIYQGVCEIYGIKPKEIIKEKIKTAIAIIEMNIKIIKGLYV